MSGSKKLLFMLICGVCFSAGGQNLVPNPDFETSTSCPSGPSQLNKLTPWFHPPNHQGTADFFHLCSSDSWLSVPQNFYGDELAAGGSGYIGLMLYAVNYREYAEVPLSTPLIAGKVYEMSFKYSLSDHSKYASDDLGVYFSQGTVNGAGDDYVINVTPQLTSPVPLDNKTGWSEIKMFYTATGNEQYMIIGNFNDDANTTKYFVSNTFINGSYIYLDDISLIPSCLPPNLGADTILCQGQTISLNASRPNATYLWSDNSTTPRITVSQAGTYFVKVTVDNCMKTDSIRIFYHDIPAVSLGNDTQLCEGNMLYLNASFPNATYLWHDNSTSPVYQVFQEGTFRVTATTYCGSATDSIRVNYKPLPVANLGNDTLLCKGEVISFNVNQPSSQYVWSDRSTSPVLQVNQPGIYWVKIDNGFCSGYDSVKVSYSQLQQVDLGYDTTLCAGNTMILNARNPGASYLWQNNSTSSGYEVAQTGTYWVKVTRGRCSLSDTVKITYRSMPEVNLGKDTFLCEGDELLLKPLFSADYSYRWSDYSADPSLTITSPGNYWVSVSNGQCKATDSISVFYHVIPGINLGADTLLCEGASLSLHVDTGNNVNCIWQDFSTGPDHTIYKKGNYFVVLSKDRCFRSDSINVDFKPVPKINLGNDTSLCSGTGYILNAFYPGASYLWHNGTTASTAAVNNQGSSWVQVSKDGCNHTDTLNVAYRPLPVVRLGSDTLLCSEQTLLLNVWQPGGSYQWNDHSTASTLQVTQAGEFSVQVTVDECVASDTIVVQYTALPKTDLGYDTILCHGETLMLDAHYPGATYLWQNGTHKPVFKVTSGGTYTVIVELGYCSNADSISINYKPLPDFTLGKDTLLCEGTELKIGAILNDAVYLWQNGSEEPEITASKPGTYWQKITQGYCSATDSVEIHYADRPSLNLGHDTSLCEGDQILLNAFNNDAYYLWHDRSNLPTFLVKKAGQYYVEVKNTACSSADTITVAYLAPPLTNLGNDTTVCRNSSFMLNAEHPGCAYLWNNEFTGAEHRILEPGTFWVKVSNQCGTSSDTIEINMELCECTVYIPNAFSPNGDEINDLFIPQTQCTFDEYDLTVFNRWGQKMFESTDPETPWSGNRGTFYAPTDTYVYVLRYRFSGDKWPKSKTGNFALLR